MEYVFIACLIIIIIYLVYTKINLTNALQANSNISITNIQEMSSIVSFYINLQINKAIVYYSRKDIEFDEKSPIKNLFKEKYRDLIQYLLRSDIRISVENEDGVKESSSFFEYFFNNLYTRFVAETPDYVKNMIYKLHSGYSLEDYYLKKRPAPNILPYVLEYVRSTLWKLHTENQINDIQMYNEARRTSTDSTKPYTDMLDNYDRTKLHKIFLNIYSLGGESPKIQRENHDSSETDQRFKVDFNQPVEK